MRAFETLYVIAIVIRRTRAQLCPSAATSKALSDIDRDVPTESRRLDFTSIAE